MSDDTYTYTYTTTTTTGLGGMDPMVYSLMLVLWLALAVLMIVSLWKLFKKAGKPGWASIVPFYNTWVMVEIAGLSALWFVLLFIPFVNIVAIVFIYNGIAKAFGKGAGTTALMIFFPYVMFPYLGLSKKVTYQGEPQDNLAATGVTNSAPQNPTPPTNTPPTTPVV